MAVIFQVGVLVNLAWPRPAVYGADHWYFQWGAFTFTGVLGGVGVVYYLIKQRGRPATVLAEHRATDTVPWPAAATSQPLTRWGTSPISSARFLLSTRWGPDDLARIAAVTETEVIPRGKTIFSQGAGPVEYLWVVRSGSVEIIHDGRVLDLLGPGELFGHASMISGLPTGFEARAAEDTVCYRIPADVVRPLLARPDVLRFVARSIVDRAVTATPPVPRADPVQSRVGTLIRTPPLVCQGGEPIREAAKRMTDQGASAVLVPHGGTFGIVTDRDLRSRVIAAGLSPDAPVSAIMTEPAYTVTADRLGGDVLLDMLERNVHHIPVLSAAGEILGVVDDGDLVAAEGRKPLLLRRAIALAESPADLATAAAGLTPMIIALHDARVAAEHVAAVRSVVLDALTRRLVELAVRDAGEPPVPFTWFALGSLARREAVPSSDVDSALAWEDESAARRRAATVAGYLGRVAQAVDDGPAGVRDLARRPRRERGQPAVRPVAGLLAPGGAEPERGSDPGEGADPGVGDHRQPPGVEHQGLGRRRAVGGAGLPRPSRPAAAAGPLRAVVPAAHGVPARLRGRALGRAPRPARHQARRADPDRRPGSLGRAGGRDRQRAHPGAAARGRGGRNHGEPGGAHADGGVRLHLLAAP